MRVIITSNIEKWTKQANATSKAFTIVDTVRNLNVMLKQRMQRISQEMFKTEGAFGKHGRWKPLNPVYAERKAKQYPGKGILRRKDRLLKSLTSNSENISTGTRTGTGYSYRFGTSIEPYPRLHQRGSGRLPQRRIFDITEQQGRGMVAAMGRTIVDGLFTRRWFDRMEQTRFINTGFDVMVMED
jgi:phage gpG-like protein